MELKDLKEFAEKARPDQLEALRYLGAWLNEMSQQYCTCSVRCMENCDVAKALGEAIQVAFSRK